MQLQNASLTELTHYLQNQDFIGKNETVINTSVPGDGNMNYTIRVETDEQSIIAKQANPYVQKYQQIPAPQQRALTEASFYITVQDNDQVAGMMPGFIGVDAQNFILALEDLGHGKDCTYLYKKEKHLAEEELKKLCGYLQALHGNFSKPVREDVPVRGDTNQGERVPVRGDTHQGEDGEENELMANRQLRALNHEHIFVYPFMEDNGFDLENIQTGLQKIALRYKQNAALKEKALHLGQKYMADGNVLLHGDFYPGSWLIAGDEIKVIDPEFCFYGNAEFDIGVMIAHLYLAGEPESLVKKLHEFYIPAAGFDQELCRNYIGIEIFRRIIGLAQLPLSLSLQEKESLLTKAETLLG